MTSIKIKDQDVVVSVECSKTVFHDAKEIKLEGNWVIVVNEDNQLIYPSNSIDYINIIDIN